METVKPSWVIRHTGKQGKNNLNCGDYYGSSGHNGMWTYHRWVPEKEARTFKTQQAAQQFKDAHKKSISKIWGRVVKLTKGAST